MPKTAFQGFLELYSSHLCLKSVHLKPETSQPMGLTSYGVQDDKYTRISCQKSISYEKNGHFGLWMPTKQPFMFKKCASATPKQPTHGTYQLRGLGRLIYTHFMSEKHFVREKWPKMGISGCGCLQNGHLCLKSVHLRPQTSQPMGLTSYGVQDY